MKMRNILWLLFLTFLAASCTNAGRLKSDEASLAAEIRELKAQGAIQTSPREIAIAEANLDFFDEEYDERDYWAAEDVLAHIRENVQKAKSHTNLALDSDNDGVPDMDDLCPEDPGPSENRGCPAGPGGATAGQALPPSTFWSEASRNILFQAGSAKLMKFSEASLNPVAAALVADPTAHIRVEGYTDSVGDPKKNRELSLQRAEAVKAYLVAHGADPAQVSAIGYGAEQPIASNKTEEGRRANRRVELHPQ